MTTLISRMSGEADLKGVAAGAGVAKLSPDDSQKMASEVLKLAEGASRSDAVPAGSDCYIYVYSGSIEIVCDGARSATVPAGSIGLVREGASYKLTGRAPESLAMRVTAPPSGAGGETPGLSEALTVKDVAALPELEVPEQKKVRTYIVTDDTVGSLRAHGMIVKYTAETVTALHHHPDAESIFLFLTGNGIVTANGEERVVEPGDVIFFGMHDRHSLRSASGEGMSFLEYHIPGKYTTVRT